MEIDYSAQEAKRAELLKVALNSLQILGQPSQQIASDVLDAFVTLTPPSEPEATFEFITLDPMHQRASSRKPGNILLNWRKLVDTLPDVTLAGATAFASPPWLSVVAALYIWNSVRRNSEELLSDVEATIIFALWQKRNSMNKLSEEDGFAHTNNLRKAYNLSTLSRSQFDIAINHLLKIRCLKIDSGSIWLREWVRVTY